MSDRRSDGLAGALPTTASSIASAIERLERLQRGDELAFSWARRRTLLPWEVYEAQRRFWREQLVIALAQRAPIARISK